MEPLLNERDATTQWRQLTNGKEITAETLADAKALLDQLSFESPLRIRFAAELEELEKLIQNKSAKEN